MRRGLSAVVPAADRLEPAQAEISDRLIQSTAKAAVASLTPGGAAGSVSASVATLVMHSLRATIVSRLSVFLGGMLIISAGIGASVLAQGQGGQKKSPGDVAPRGATTASTGGSARGTAPVFEYEIRIWKDGAPVMPALKRRRILARFPR